MVGYAKTGNPDPPGSPQARTNVRCSGGSVRADTGPASATNVAQRANALGIMITPYPHLPFSKSIIDAATEDVELVRACTRADHLRVEIFTLQGPVRREAIFDAQASNDASAPGRGRAILQHTKRTAGHAGN